MLVEKRIRQSSGPNLNQQRTTIGPPLAADHCHDLLRIIYIPQGVKIDRFR
jgi:hypothetical protein